MASGTQNTELFRVKLEIATLLHNISNKDLYSFTELYKNLANNMQIKLYVFIYFLLFIRTLLTEYFKQAI